MGSPEHNPGARMRRSALPTPCTADRNQPVTTPCRKYGYARIPAVGHYAIVSSAFGAPFGGTLRPQPPPKGFQSSLAPPAQGSQPRSNPVQVWAGVNPPPKDTMHCAFHTCTYSCWRVYSCWRALRTQYPLSRVAWFDKALHFILPRICPCCDSFTI